MIKMDINVPEIIETSLIKHARSGQRRFPLSALQSLIRVNLRGSDRRRYPRKELQQLYIYLVGLEKSGKIKINCCIRNYEFSIWSGHLSEVNDKFIKSKATPYLSHLERRKGKGQGKFYVEILVEVTSYFIDSLEMTLLTETY